MHKFVHACTKINELAEINSFCNYLLTLHDDAVIYSRKKNTVFYMLEMPSLVRLKSEALNCNLADNEFPAYLTKEVTGNTY